jgi:CheY-like chemotaxis protein
MDVQMPVMDGFTATEKIRQWEENNKLAPTPIVALTAHAMQDVVEQAKKAGCDCCLRKPIRKNRLLKTLAQILQQNNKNGADIR